jgi:hypothetical protein
MPQINQNRPLKVCHTCGQWIYKYKGLCERLGQGVGKFWHCEEWTAAGGENPGSKSETPGKDAPTSP